MFTFYSDPGHGWLKVSVADVLAVGLDPIDFSRYSPRRGVTLFLEEDCDAPKFLRAWKAKHGTEAPITEALVNSRNELF